MSGAGGGGAGPAAGGAMWTWRQMCVRMRARACVRAYEHVCMCACACACVCVEGDEGFHVISQGGVGPGRACGRPLAARPGRSRARPHAARLSAYLPPPTHPGPYYPTRALLQARPALCGGCCSGPPRPWSAAWRYWTKWTPPASGRVRPGGPCVCTARTDPEHRTRSMLEGAVATMPTCFFTCLRAPGAPC